MKLPPLRGGPTRVSWGEVKRMVLVVKQTGARPPPKGQIPPGVHRVVGPGPSILTARWSHRTHPNAASPGDKARRTLFT